MTRTALFSLFTAILVLSFVVFTNMAFAAKDKAPAQKTPTVITEDNMAEHIFSKDYKDWRLVCNKAETQCRIFQRLSLQKDEQLQTLPLTILGCLPPSHHAIQGSWNHSQNDPSFLALFKRLHPFLLAWLILALTSLSISTVQASAKDDQQKR